MSLQNPVGPRFRIERLEDRVVPGCLLSQGQFFEGLLAAWATFNGSETLEPSRMVSSRITALRKSLNAHDAVRKARAPATDTARLPVWVEKFLDEIETDLANAERFNAGTVSEIRDGQSAHLDALLAHVDQALVQAETSHADTKRGSQESMPSWAEDLLLQFRHETSQRLNSIK
jgi:hypothetical protein